MVLLAFDPAVCEDAAVEDAAVVDATRDGGVYGVTMMPPPPPPPPPSTAARRTGIGYGSDTTFTTSACSSGSTAARSKSSGQGFAALTERSSLYRVGRRQLRRTGSGSGP